jgi:serine/threonine-protein kinase
MPTAGVLSLDPTTRERWRRLLAALDDVFEQSPEARSAWLEALSAADPQLHREVREILRIDAQLGGTLDGSGGGRRQRYVADLEARSHAVPELSRQTTDAIRALVTGVLSDLRADLAGGGPASDSTASARDAARRFLPGTLLADRYRIEGLIGRGACGEVYRADDVTLEETVALKFVPVEIEHQPGRLDRLLGEVRLARHISHPNVCRVFDAGQVDGRHFLSMEFIDGEDLASLLRRIGRLPPEKALDIARQVCAGLAAAHELGILHRDLKPANIMLDGRGRVRITDFGLAIAGEAVHGVRAREGTPAYQAPEQLDGREASARSDLYALGLVLYELFTGRRAYSAPTLAGLQERQRQPPPGLASLVAGVEPAVEEAILACLHHDPAARPGSVREVLASLPGGEPLAEALAAGETPSPEMVAAAGPRGVLEPRVAGALLVATVALLALILALSDRASLLGRLPAVKSIDVLEENAREILRRLGYDERPADRSRRVGAYGYYRPFVDTIGALSDAPDRWAPLRHPGEIVSNFEYRQSARPLIPLGGSGQVEGDQDPPMGRGDALVVTTLGGRLLKLVVVPAQNRSDLERRPVPDWNPLLAAAGLDGGAFESVASTITPPVFADERVAWKGSLPEFGGYPVRIEAAAERGRPVYFELFLGWKAIRGAVLPTAEARFVTPPDRWLRPNVLLAILACVGIAGALLARRQWRRGLGDRRGALRVGVAFAVLSTGVWMLGAHHVPDGWGEAQSFMRALASALQGGLVVWVLYLALEPYARRRPGFVIAWTRLLQGRLRDPLVGRDLLIGIVGGSAIFVLRQQLSVVLPEWLGIPGPPPAQYPGPPLPGQPLSQPILGGRFVAAEFLMAALSALAAVLTMMALLTVLRLLLRRDRLAIPMFVLLLAMLAPPYHLGGYSVVSIGAGILLGSIWAWLVHGPGLVASLGAYFAWHVAAMFPITSEVAAPHFGIGLIGLLAVLAVAAYGAQTATRGLRRVALPARSVGHAA